MTLTLVGKKRCGLLWQDFLSAFLGLALNACLPGTATAAPEEIQVYLDDFTEVGKAGLDLHTNYVSSGQQVADHEFRLTPELSYGVNDHWEVATYWLLDKDPGRSVNTDGMKLRAKWRPRAPSADSVFYWAVNFEAGQLARTFYQDETSSEIKLIGVWKPERWTIGVNYNLDRALKTHPFQAATSEIDTKIAYQVRDGLQLGIENYSFLGAIHYDPSQPGASQANYLAADFSVGRWDFNVGIGHGSGQTTDHTIIKAIIGVPL